MFFFIPFATSPVVIAGGIFLGVWVLSGRIYTHRDLWISRKWVLPVFLFMVLPIVGLLWTSDMDMGIKFAVKSHYWLLAFAAASIPLDLRQVKMLLCWLMGGLLLVSVASLLTYALGASFIPQTLTVFNSKYITISILLVFGMMLSSYNYAHCESNREKAVSVLLTIIFFITLSVSKGRIGYIAFAAMAPFIVFNFTRKKIVVALMCVGLIAALLCSHTVQQRIDDLVVDLQRYEQGEVDLKSSAGQRLHMWEGGVKIFLDNPIIGVGPGGYTQAMKQYNYKLLEQIGFSDPHNGYLHVAVSLGLVGLLSLFWLLAAYFRKGWACRKTLLGYAVLAFGAVLAIGSLTGNQFVSLATANLFAVMMGLESRSEDGGS
jgi:O-antigen ligase